MFAHNLVKRNYSSSNGEENRAGNTTLRSPNRTRSSSSNRSNRRIGETSNSQTLITRNLNDKQSPKGLEDLDHMILWPPMVIVQNSLFRTDENGKELHNYFKDYNISDVKNSYGVSLLIFPRSASGYLEAECLHRNFLREGQGKDDWENHGSNCTHSSEDHLLYCYMASEEDMDSFNKHSKGHLNQKFEMKSYKMMVLDPFKKIEDNDLKLIQLGENLRLRKLEIETMERRTREEIEEYQNGIDYLKNYYADTIKKMTNNHLEKIEMEYEEVQKSFHMVENQELLSA